MKWLKIQRKRKKKKKVFSKIYFYSSVPSVVAFSEVFSSSVIAFASSTAFSVLLLVS